MQTTKIRSRGSGESVSKAVHQQKIMRHEKKQKRVTHTQGKQAGEKVCEEAQTSNLTKATKFPL